MVDSSHTNGAVATPAGSVSWRTVLEAMRATGIQEQEISQVVTAAEPKPINTTRAAEIAGKAEDVIRTWIQRHHLDVVGYEEHRPTQGGRIRRPLVDEGQLRAFLLQLRRPGRPPKP